MFVDSDDYICDGAVQVLYERLVADDSDMAVGKHTDVYDNGATNDAYCAFMKDAVLTRNDVFQGMGKYAVSAWGKLYKREMLESIRYPALKCAEDLWVFPAILDQCTRISVVNQTVYYYFQNAESITQKKSEQAKCDELEAILRITELLWHRGFCESAKRYYAKAISKALLFARKAEARARFQKHFDRQKRKDLLKGQTFKTQAKWLLLYFPVIYTVIRYVKRTVGRD